jgi:hypothetical protein
MKSSHIYTQVKVENVLETNIPQNKAYYVVKPKHNTQEHSTLFFKNIPELYRGMFNLRKTNLVLSLQ